MKKNTVFFLGLMALMSCASLFAASIKAFDKSVPAEESATIYIPKGSVVFMINGTKYGVKGNGGESWQNKGKELQIAKPSFLIPSGEHTVRGAVENTYDYTARNVTNTFIAGRHYQMVIKFPAGFNFGNVFKEFAKSNAVGMDWCFLDITEAVEAKKKGVPGYAEMVDSGELGEGQVIVK
ncbi:MAG: hypothetical protein LBG95_05250 [Treponema sp.]|nr:hypothetical protein [Treponema sp.]